MLPLAFLLVPFPVATLATLSEILGVHPDLAPVYKAATQSSRWKCLDGSKEIPFSAVNDDYCDCPDGSDEPGTSACPGTTFYCKNIGHIGSHIPSSRVNDGLCEIECCDGSDEPFGVCPNLCEKIGKEHRDRLAAELKLRKTGSKIRASYIAFAQKEKKRLEESILALSKEVELKQQEEQRLKVILDQTESLSKAALEHKKKSPLYLSLQRHSQALDSLLTDYKKLQEREKMLADILETLRTGYNPNYQDMAVLEAVRGWETLSSENPPAEDETKDPDLPELPETDPWDEERIESLLSEDQISLLLAHDTHIATENNPSPLFNLASYMPDSLVPSYESSRSSLVSWLSFFGIISGHDMRQSDEANRARAAHAAAQTALEGVRYQQENAELDLKKLFSPEWFGPDGEWKKLDGTCLEHDVGEYIYEICLFGAATQRSTKNGGSHSLGRFTSWHNSPDVEIGSPEYYSRQVYSRGTRCWNGPERSITVDFVCGTENTLREVSEPEKCEYHVKGTTPALCLPLDAKSPPTHQDTARAAKEEL